MTPDAPRLEIVVDELVVRGLPPAEARAAAAALEARLTEIASARREPLPARAESYRRLPAVAATAGSAAAVGEAAAAAVWRSIVGETR